MTTINSESSKLSFGVQVEPQFGYVRDDIDRFVERIEHSQHFDSVWVSDHLFMDENAVDKSAFDCFTLMTYLLTKYQKIRVGSLVLCNSYRHPSILAKMLTTLDHLSGGRFEFGYGAAAVRRMLGRYFAELQSGAGAVTVAVNLPDCCCVLDIAADSGFGFADEPDCHW